MRRNNIVHGNIYYSIQENPLYIVKFIMSDDIFIIKPQYIFETFIKAKIKAVKLLNKNHFKRLKNLDKPVSVKKYDEIYNKDR